MKKYRVTVDIRRVINIESVSQEEANMAVRRLIAQETALMPNHVDSFTWEEIPAPSVFEKLAAFGFRVDGNSAEYTETATGRHVSVLKRSSGITAPVCEGYEVKIVSLDGTRMCTVVPECDDAYKRILRYMATGEVG